MIKISESVVTAWAIDRVGKYRRSASAPHKIRVKTCPFCGNSKYANSFNMRTGYFECWRHAQTHNIYEVVRAVEDITDPADMAVLWFLKDYTPPGVELVWKPRAQRPADILTPAPIRAELSIARSDEWDNFSNDWRTYDGQAFYKYAMRRGVSEAWIRSGRIGYFKSGGLAGRLAFVTYENGAPVFAVGRSIRPEIKPKYLTQAGKIASQVVFNLDLLKTGSMAVVCEGVLSAISCGAGGMAVFGNQVSWEQAAKIALRTDQAVIVREKGVALDVALESCERLHACGVRTLLASLPTEADPNDDPAQMPQVIQRANKIASENEIYRMRLASKKEFLHVLK